MQTKTAMLMGFALTGAMKLVQVAINLKLVVMNIWIAVSVSLAGVVLNHRYNRYHEMKLVLGLHMLLLVLCEIAVLIYRPLLHLL